MKKNEIPQLTKSEKVKVLSEFNSSKNLSIKKHIFEICLCMCAAAFSMVASLTFVPVWLGIEPMLPVALGCATIVLSTTAAPYNALKKDLLAFKRLTNRKMTYWQYKKLEKTGEIQKWKKENAPEIKEYIQAKEQKKAEMKAKGIPENTHLVEYSFDPIPKQKTTINNNEMER